MTYGIEITHHRPRAGRMNTGGYTATITRPDGTTLTSPRFDTEALASAWADKYVAAHQAGLVRPAAVVTAAAPAAVTAPRIDRQADRVANLTGLPTPKSTGRCHYCGQPLNRRGYCEECV